MCISQSAGWHESGHPRAGRGATSGGGGGRQRVHVGGLPALHHWLAQDLQVHVRRVVGRGRRQPRRPAVLSRREDGGRGGGAHIADGRVTLTAPEAKGWSLQGLLGRGV